MSDAILVVNAGSSSIKFSLFLKGGPRISTADSGLVIPTNKGLMIARHTAKLAAADASC